LEAKLAGARQLLHVVNGNVPRPVPTPRDLIQPSRVTCRQCHWAGMRSGDQLRVIREYAADEANSDRSTLLRLKVGDRWSGIHRHMSMEIEYAEAPPGAERIPLVRLRQGQAPARQYMASELSPGTAVSGPMRAMDCTDCHNRPAHTFAASPERAVDAALADGLIPRRLPFVRREAVNAITAAYDGRAAAMAGIARRLQAFYQQRAGSDAALVRQAVSGAQQAWSINVFPAMKVTWGTYPNHLGHVDTPGCFRCHDDRRSADGKAAISQECELCHSIPE
jgi:hypothetical protein